MSYERELFLKRLQAALAELPSEQREVFLLKEVSGLKFREIAEVVAFLTSEWASFAIGTVFMVDGGYSVQIA